MDFLVTGGAGFIGSHLVEHLISYGHDVTVIDNLHTGNKENLKHVINQIEFVSGDIKDHELLRKLFKNKNGIFHEAALASVQESFTKQKEYHDVNVNGTENILKLAKEFGIKVVYASSSSVYGNPTKIPIKEDAERKPINPYARTKLEDEYLAEKYAKMGVSVVGFRYFNVYGERQSNEYAGVIKLFLERIQQQKSPLVNGDGLQTRDFVYVDDVVNANILAMKSQLRQGFINIGSGNSISILELAKTVIKSSGLPLEPIHKPSLEGDVRETKADITLAKKLLSWEPKTKLEDWLDEIISKMKIEAKY